MKQRFTTADYPLPRFDDEDWTHIEGLIGASLDEDARTQIELTANNYVVAREVSQNKADRRAAKGKSKPPIEGPDGHPRRAGAKITTPMWQLTNAMEKLSDCWNKVWGDDGLREILRTYDNRFLMSAHTVPLETLIGGLRYHNIALRLHLRERDKIDPFDSLVGNLAKIFYHATGKRPTVALPRDGSTRTSRFVDFVDAIDTKAPHPAKHDGSANPGAWSQTVRRALNDYRQRGNSHPAP